MKVVGTMTGDNECWCFLVSREDYVRIKGHDPDKWDTWNTESPFRYKVYPSDLAGESYAFYKEPVLLTFEVMPVAS